MAYQWNYTRTPGHQVGLMICTACNRKITEGQYRYRETEEAYLPQHRACSLADPKWAKLDAEDATRADFDKRRRTAYMAFVAEFGEPHDLIEPEEWYNAI